MLTKAERDQLRHALGLTNSRKIYRNRFVSGPDCDTFPAWKVLCEKGYAEDNGPQEFFGGMHVFVVTDLGIRAARRKVKADG